MHYFKYRWTVSACALLGAAVLALTPAAAVYGATFPRTAGVSGVMLQKPVWPYDTGVLSESGIVMDLDSGAVLYGQRIHMQEAPASITKLLTALVVLENASLDERVVYSHDAVYNVEGGSGNKYSLDEGDELSVEDALYLLLLASSNQSANALAEHVGGSREGFVKMMNRKAKELGCEDSHFANPSGLNDDTQLTSAYDMALIGKAAYSNEKLLEIGSATSHKIAPTKNYPSGPTVKMEHKLLITEDETSPEYYPYAVAGKTGYTSIAGQTLVTYAVKEDRRLIAVTMKSTARTHYSDTIALLNFGFNQFKNVKIAEFEKDMLTGDAPVELGGDMYEPADLSIDENAVATVPVDAELSDADRVVLTGADMPEEAPVGAAAYLRYEYDDRVIGGVFVESESKAVAATAPSEPETAETVTEPETEAAGGVGQVFHEFVSGIEEGMHSVGRTIRYGIRDISEMTSGLPKNVLYGVVGGLAVCLAVLYYTVSSGLQARKAERELEGRRERRKKRLRELGVSEEEFASMVDARWGESAEAARAAEAAAAEVAAADAVNLVPENVEDLDSANTAEFAKIRVDAGTEEKAPEKTAKTPEKPQADPVPDPEAETGVREPVRKPRSRRKPGTGPKAEENLQKD